MPNTPPVQREIQSPVPPRERPQEPREPEHPQREQREQPRSEIRSEALRPLPGQPANQLFQRREAHVEQPHRVEQAKPKPAN